MQLQNLNKHGSRDALRTLRVLSVDLRFFNLLFSGVSRDVVRWSAAFIIQRVFS